jgi:hypothetical protein
MNSASRFASSEEPNSRPRAELQAEIDVQVQEFLKRGGKIQSASLQNADPKEQSKRWNGSKPVGIEK